MKKRWKPKEGEKFYFVEGFYEFRVSSQRWDENVYDMKMYRNHNVFRTKKEAQQAVRRVKVALKGER